MFRALLLLPLALAALAQGLPVRQLTSNAELVADQPFPGFRGGYLFYLQGASVRLYSPDGFPVLSTVLQIPNARDVSAEGFAVDTDGSAAVSAEFKAPGGYGAGIAFFDRNGQFTEFVNTGRYSPSNICFGEDHSLWTFGWQRDGLKPDRPDSIDYSMVHRYSSDHKEQGRYLARSLFPKGLEPGMGTWQDVRIAVAHDRVGLLAWSGMNASLNEWVELDLKGNTVRRLRIDHSDSLEKLAFTADGRLFRQIQRQPNLEILDQTTSEWKDAGPAPGGWLWGADGNSLVFSPEWKLGPIALEWFEAPKAS